MVDTGGMKRFRGPHYSHPLFHRPKKPLPPAKTPEEIAAERARHESGMKEIFRDIAPKWGVPPEDFEEWYADEAAYSQRKAMEKLADQEARKAVEGETDLNHDNMEGPADASRG